MDIIPNLRIARSGHEYQDAALVLEHNNLQWAAAINAALAIEIYLKSFLAKDTWNDYYAGGKYKTFEEAERGHKLTKLYNKIPETHRESLKAQVATINPETDLEKSLDRYNNVFFEARYPYEEASLKMVDSGIVRLAEIIKHAIINLTTAHEIV